MFQDKKLGGLGCNPKYKWRNLYQDNCVAINEAKKTINNNELKVKAFLNFGMGANPKAE